MAAPEVLKAQYACNTNDDGSVCAYSTNADGSINIAAYAGPPWAGTIPGSINGMAVTTIGANAFGGCGSLTNVTIPNSVASIGPAAFYDCARLLSVTIPGGVTNIGCDAFEGCAMLANANIPDGVTSIADRTFAGCASLASVAIPGSVTNIGEFAFGFCPCLTNVTLAGGLAAIQETAFYCCPALASVTIPGSVTNLGDYAFGFCPGLGGAYFQGSAPAADSTVFTSDAVAAVYYLPGVAGWSNTFAGLQTARWFLPNPLILNNGHGFGLQGKEFGFTISWATNTSVVVESCSNLAGLVWNPLRTNMLTNGTWFFSEPLRTDSPGRFYRVRSRAASIGSPMTSEE